MSQGQDSRARAPQGRYGTPGWQYPSPNAEDLIIIEEGPIGDESYEALQPGTPHPIKPEALLVKEEPGRSNGRERNVRRIYATERAAQEAYNAALQYANESSEHPIYIRSYIVPRAGYTPGAYGQPLKRLTGITLESGGTGYKQPVTVTFTGGGGSGAAAKVSIRKGVIVAIWLTNSGTGYTSAPTITFESAQGSGASAVAQIQPQTAVLVKEERSNIEDGTLSSLFIRVTQVWKTLPGYPLPTVALGNMGIYGKFLVGKQITSTVQDVAAGTNPTALSSNVLSSQVQAVSRWEAQRTDVTKTGSWSTLTSKGIVDGRIASITESIVTDGAALPTFSTATFDLDRSTMGNGESQQRLVVSDALNPRVSYKRTFGGNLEKRTVTIVDAGTVPSEPGSTELASEVRDRNDWQADQIVTEIVDSDGNALTAFPLKKVTYKDPRTKVEITRYTQWQPATATLASLNAEIGDEFPSGSGCYVIESRLEESDDSDKKLLIVESCPLPEDRVEYPSKAFSFPGVMKYLTGWTSGDERYQKPWPGVHYTYKPPRTIQKSAKAFYSYTLGPNAEPLPETYRVESPGGASKILGRFISSNTVHDGFTVLQDGQTVELIPASTPATYDPTAPLVADTEEKPWRGMIFERVIFKMVETGDPHDIE